MPQDLISPCYAQPAKQCHRRLPALILRKAVSHQQPDRTNVLALPLPSPRGPKCVASLPFPWIPVPHRHAETAMSSSSKSTQTHPASYVSKLSPNFEPSVGPSSLAFMIVSSNAAECAVVPPISFLDVLFFHYFPTSIASRSIVILLRLIMLAVRSLNGVCTIDTATKTW
jgi:hypothetical protein